MAKAVGIVDRLLGDRRGNVAMMLALAMVPLLFAIGMGIDYTSASYREDQLNSFADAAALAALRPTVLAQPDAASVAAATAAFNAQASTLTGVIYDPTSLTVTVADAAAGNGQSVTRTVTVSYNASSQNAFSGILGSPTIALSGSAQGKAAGAPNIDFYLLLDSSPSMLLGATAADQAALMKLTKQQDSTSTPPGCAFACHETCPQCENGGAGLGNPGGVDNYALAQANNVTLRIDNLRTATKNLMSTAQFTAGTDNEQFRMAIYTFDVSFNTIQTLTSSLTLAQNAAGNIQALTVYSNNWLTSTKNNSDADTDYDNAMNNINKVMPAPGNGTNASGDTPQEVLFFVTDGLEDEGSPRVMTPMNDPRGTSGLASTDWCTLIKNRGIRIVVLYTEYVPPTTDPWYRNQSGIPAYFHTPPTPSDIEIHLQACASPGLYTKVDNGGDITTALTNLFNQVVSTAYLAK